jgi:hypothetical protein
MFSTILNYTLNILHLFLIFSPILLFFVNLPHPIYKYMLIVPILVVTHWSLLTNQCLLTIFQKNLGFIEEGANFSNTYLRWFYEPIMKIFRMVWNDDNLDIIIDMHWVVNFFIIWYFTFF